MSDIDEWTNEIHQGDAVEVLEQMPESSVHFVVTSPPYWNIKDYETEEQIGYDDSIEEYIQRLSDVWTECYRVLKPGCRMVINLGDQYVNATDEKPYHVVPLNSFVVSNITKQTDFLCLGSIIWHKQTNTNSSGGASVMGSFGRPRNGYVSYSHEYINIFKKPGKAPSASDELKEQDAIDSEQWKDLFSDHWTFTGERQDLHPAPFPEELPRRLVRMFTFTGDSVLDPFMGSGTTAIAAEKLDRDWIGIDLNKNYVRTAYERLESETKCVFDDRSVFEI